MKNVLFNVVPKQSDSSVVVGPNLNVKDKDKDAVWSVRFADKRGNTAVPNDLVAMTYEDSVAADKDEDASGCSSRVKGRLCQFSDLPSGMVPLHFRVGSGRFADDDWNTLTVSHLLFLPNGAVLGKVVKDPNNLGKQERPIAQAVGRFFG